MPNQDQPTGARRKTGETPVDIEIRDGGTEDLMVKGTGGTLPLKDSEAPHYYTDSQKAKGAAATAKPKIR